MHTDTDIRQDLFSNIVLAGGSTLFPGIEERMKKEISALADPGTNIEIHASDKRKYSAWIGGSMLASLSTFEEKVMTKDRYEEDGPSALHRICL